MATQSINFSDVMCYGSLIIDTTNTLSVETKLLNQLFQSLWDNNYLNAEKYVLDLLKFNNDNAKYNYLCADCYLWLHEEQGMSSRDKVEYYYINSLKIEPNNLECLLSYTRFLSSYNHSETNNNSKMMSLHQHIFSVFETKTYQYDPGCTDIDIMEVKFQKQWIMDFVLSHGYYNTDNAIVDFLGTLRPNFHRLLSLNKLFRTNHSYILLESYINAYSRIGNYSQIIQLLSNYNQKYNYLLKNHYHVCQYLWVYLEMGMFDKLRKKIHTITSFEYKPRKRSIIDKDKQYIIKPIVDAYHWLNNKIVCHGYLCLMYAYKQQSMSDKLVHNIFLRCQNLIQQYQKFLKKDQHKLSFLQRFQVLNIPLSMQFMNLCFVYLCVMNNCKSKHQQVVTILKSSRIYYEQLSFLEYSSIEHYVISLILFLYVSGLIVNNQDKYVQITDTGQDANIYFAKCLSLAKECIDNGTVSDEKLLLVSEPIWIHPIIPLSYYQLGLNAYKSHKFQIAFRFIKKAIGMTQDLDVIGNSSELLEKCRIGWMQRLCGYCKRTYSDMNRKNKCCKGCGLVFYCSKQCNKLNWKNKHKYECDKKWLRQVDHLKTIW
eukprot:269536_1